MKLTDNQSEALRQTENQYRQTYNDIPKDEPIEYNDLIKFYRNNMLNNDANQFRDKNMRELIAEAIAQDINDFQYGKLKDYEEVYGNKQNGYEKTLKELKENPALMLEYINEDKKFHEKLNEQENVNFCNKFIKEIKETFDIYEIIAHFNDQTINNETQLIKILDKEEDALLFGKELQRTISNTTNTNYVEIKHSYNSNKNIIIDGLYDTNPKFELGQLKSYDINTIKVAIKRNEAKNQTEKHINQKQNKIKKKSPTP